MGPGLWRRLERTDIAADGEGNVYVTDGRTVFRIVGHVAEVFLTPEELDPRGDRRVDLLAVDDEGNLAVLLPVGVRIFGPEGHPIAERNMREVASARRLAPRSPADMVVTSLQGLVHVRDGAPPALLYSRAMVGGSTASCLDEAIGAARDRVYYLPGCTGSSIYAGARDGSGIRELVTADLFEAVFDRFVMFEGIAPHPSSGVLALSCDAGLFHVHEDESFTSLWTWRRNHFCSYGGGIAVSGSDVFALVLEEDAVHAFRDVL